MQVKSGLLLNCSLIQDLLHELLKLWCFDRCDKKSLKCIERFMSPPSLCLPTRYTVTSTRPGNEGSFTVHKRLGGGVVTPITAISTAATGVTVWSWGHEDVLMRSQGHESIFMIIVRATV